MKPKVAFIGTGGTIASVGVGPLDLQDYGATGKVMHADEIIARFPEAGLVADVLPVRYRNIPSTAIDFTDWKALALLCAKLEAELAELPEFCHFGFRRLVGKNLAPESSSATARQRSRRPRVSST